MRHEKPNSDKLFFCNYNNINVNEINKIRTLN